MKDYSKMSDFEINKAVALILGIEVVEWGGKIFGGVERKIDNVTSVIGAIDYCNSPSDAWPIIVENSISIVSYGVEFSAEYGWSAFYGGVCVDYNHEIVSNFEIECSDKNPLRAAMIVYLMMKDEEK